MVAYFMRASGAPFAYAVLSCMVIIYFLSELNAFSPVRGFSFSRTSLFRPAFCPGNKKRDLCRVTDGFIAYACVIAEDSGFQEKPNSFESFEKLPSLEYLRR